MLKNERTLTIDNGDNQAIEPSSHHFLDMRGQMIEDILNKYARHVEFLSDDLKGIE
jgi:hypothetical protein